MSQEVKGTDRTEPGETESGFDALRWSPEFEGAVEPVADHEHENGHFAMIHESDEELFSAVAPFVRQGLARGDRCLYVLDERTEEEVLDVLRERNVSVDAAVESGALSFYRVDETYLRNEPFDPDAMMAFYERTVAETLEEYEGLRIVAGTNWMDIVDTEDFMTYEGQVNKLFERTDSMALCTYDRTELPASVIRDVIQTHPHLIYDGTVSHNFYYTPSDEYIETEDTAKEVEHMLATVRDRTQAKTDLSEHKHFLRELNEITADPDRSFEEKLFDLFDLGCEWFDLELGALNRVDVEADRLEVEYINGEHEFYRPGEEFPLSQTYCSAAADIKAAASVTDPAEEGYDDLAVYQEFGVESYLGTYIPVEGGDDRTFAFIAPGSRPESFTEEDRTYLELMGQWVKYELEHRQYREELEETVDCLKQSNDRLKQFAYAASHDLQEPLRMVSSHLQLLENKHGEDLDEEAQEYIDFAVDGADRMRAMVEDLLAYSRVEQADGSFERVDAESVVQDALDDLTVQIEEQGAEVVVDSLPTVTADPEQLQKLFSNLLSNAVKYGGDEPARVEITAADRGDHWEFAVVDDGIGIDPDKTDRIFEVFKRLHHDEEYAGTGIGLSICQEIVENHGGDIRVDSEIGEGSTFYVTIPRRA